MLSERERPPDTRSHELVSKFPSVNTTFYAMNRMPGSMTSIFAKGKKANVSEKFLMRLAESLGNLHSIPLDTIKEYIETYNDISVLHGTIEQRHRRKIASWLEYKQDVSHPISSRVTFPFRWLNQNVPPDSRCQVLAYGDFNVYNLSLIHI